MMIRTIRRTALAAVSILLGLSSVTFAGQIIFVDAHAIGANNGATWADAYNHLQDALGAASSGDEIRVAQGVYKPDQGGGNIPGDETATFQLISGVTLKGGYAGSGEPDPNPRDIQEYETILSGDLDSNDVDVNDPWDLPNDPSRAENSYHVVTGSGTDETAILDGFTVTAGNAWRYPHTHGGGMFNRGSPTVRNCKFIGNLAGNGGGMANEGGGPRITKCTFSGNCATLQEPGDGGGGIYNYISSPVIKYCEFIGNWAANDGGAINSYAGDVSLSNCQVTDNSAWSGGGVCNAYGCRLTLKNCVLSGNMTSHADGAGIHNFQSGKVTLFNCTLTGNLASDAGGGICNDATGETILLNSVLWGNIENGIYVNESAQIQASPQSPPTINYCSIQCWTGKWGGQGNIDADPCFIAPGCWDANRVWVDGDYHLRSDSPCIDAGDPSYVPEPNETDLDGNSRIVNGTVDMGAYEFQGPFKW
jgi:hypothetical protein